MATTKSAGSKAGSRSKQAKASSSDGSRATTKAKPTGSTRAKSTGSTRAKSTGSPRARSGGSPRAKSTGSRNAASEAKPSTLKRAANRSKGPAIAAGTAAAAIAGGLVLKSRLGRKRILGVPVPRSVTNGGLSSVDLQSLAKTVGKASRQVGETSKEISKDIERIGDRAERFGKLLS